MTAVVALGGLLRVLGWHRLPHALPELSLLQNSPAVFIWCVGPCFSTFPNLLYSFGLQVKGGALCMGPGEKWEHKDSGRFYEESDPAWPPELLSPCEAGGRAMS